MAEMAERITAILWAVGSLVGLLLRLRRLWILSRLSYSDPKDQAYLRTVIRSSLLRGMVKIILLVGGLLAVWSNPPVPTGDLAYLFWIWRGGAVALPFLLLLEDLNVDYVRRRLGTLEAIRRRGAL